MRENSISVSIQSADFSSADFVIGNAADAIGLLSRHNWDEERRKRAALVESGMDECPAGLLLVDEPRWLIIHIIPTPTSYDGFVHYPVSAGKLFGIIPRTGQETYDFTAWGADRVSRLVRALYAGDRGWLTDLVGTKIAEVG